MGAICFTVSFDEILDLTADVFKFNNIPGPRHTLYLVARTRGWQEARTPSTPAMKYQHTPGNNDVWYVTLSKALPSDSQGRPSRSHGRCQPSTKHPDTPAPVYIFLYKRAVRLRGKGSKCACLLYQPMVGHTHRPQLFDYVHGAVAATHAVTVAHGVFQ